MNVLKNNAAFTLIEMIIVLMIISILLLIAIPNMTKNSSVANSKGCDATIELLQAQMGAYEIEKNERPANLEVLKTEKFVDKIVCPDNTPLKLDDNGRVVRNVE